MLALDHLVIAAKDPLESAMAFARQYQLKAIPGGKHDHWGTHNALAYFRDDCYIEWLGVENEDLARGSDNPLIQQLLIQLDHKGEGLFQYGLRTTNMEAYVEHFTREGIPFTGPLAGERWRPDGSHLSWSMLFPESDLNITPFLIEWGQEDLYGADPKLVNPRHFSLSLKTEEKLPLLEHIFQVKAEQGEIPLDNHRLIFRDQAGPKIHLSD